MNVLVFELLYADCAKLLAALACVYADVDDDPEFASCPRCMGDGTVTCHCGGDLCVCENYGEAPCPTCHGEGEVTHERYERYMKAQAEAHRTWQELLAKADSNRSDK